MASSRQRKKEVYSENSIDRKMPRGSRAQLQYYTPGSGPLRKSTGRDGDENRTEPVKNLASERLNRFRRENAPPSDDSDPQKTDNSIMERRRTKKPEQPLFVPTPVAKARETERSSYSKQDVTTGNPEWNGNGSHSQGGGGGGGGGNDRGGGSNRSKRYSNRRRNNEQDIQEEWRGQSPHRNYRQGSEPRAHQQTGNNSWNRTRDTRSVDPQINSNPNNRGNFNSDKYHHHKPPSGRRHSTIGLEPDKKPKFNIDNIPPRFRKQFLAENKVSNYPVNKPPAENWDGSTSLTFQGSSQQYPQGQKQFPNYPSNQHATQNNNYYSTLPTRSRGRGRGMADYGRPGTPDKVGVYSPVNSRPTTPSYSGRTRSNESLHRMDLKNDRNQYNRPEGNRREEHYGSGNEMRRADDYYDPRRSEDRFDVRKGDERFDARRSEDRFGGNKNKENHSGRNDDRFGGRLNEERFGNKNPECRRNNDQRYGNEFKQADQVRPESRNDDKHLTNSESQSRQQILRERIEPQTTPLTSPPIYEDYTQTILGMAVNNGTFDWSEEVELHVKNLEAEALSDAMTRSSSMASLMETSTKSLPVNVSPKNKKRKSRKKRSGSHQRDNSIEPQNRFDDYRKNGSNRRNRKNSTNSVESRDNFKVPESRPRRPSRDTREHSYDTVNLSRNVSRESSFDRTRKSSCSEQENWRDEILRKRHPVEHEIPEVLPQPAEVKKGGLIHLPQNVVSKDVQKVPVLNLHEKPKMPEIVAQRRSPGQKTLFDPNNPNTPIVVNKPNSRVGCPGFSENTTAPLPQMLTDQYGNVRPSWQTEPSQNAQACRYPDLLANIITADNELQKIIISGHLVTHWDYVITLRSFLMEALEYLLSKDIKFSQAENVEQHFWRILYYNIIELMRKNTNRDPEHKKACKTFLLNLIEEGTKFYEKLLDRLEGTYDFKINSYLGHAVNEKPGAFVNLALVSAQKIFICLGDLWRYKEQVNETSNYGKCRQMYLKAHEINPKNGRPYNQLAVLAVYSRKKLDAVYYYMRSLMSTNAVLSAKESLISLFDENRKKYEHSERKRREERIEKAKMHMREKESANSKNKHGSLRKETWIRPDGGRRVHRTTSAHQEAKLVDSEEEDLAALSSVEVNKRFVTSYLHVHGKLIMKIGMETFQETALQMLKEFRALLQHSPLPLPSTRFLQLLALNMFAIETTQLKDQQMESGYRSEVQERALVLSLQMFNLILEKCISLLSDHMKNNPEDIAGISLDAHELLPSIKIWCDWMLCHTNIWNPPPSTQDFSIGPGGEAWSRLAILMNLLETLDQSVTVETAPEMSEGFETHVRLPEDAALSGFTPLMYNDEKPSYVSKTIDSDLAQFAVRIRKIIFFGTIFLCGLEPPVLKLEYQDDSREYISVVCTSANRSSPSTPPEFNASEFLVESFSEDEEGAAEEGSTQVLEGARTEIQELLSRKVELEKRQRDQELHRQTVQKILEQSVVSVHIEVKPKNLVPDTNCFIDYLDMLKTISSSSVYTLMVPLIVLNELEGLAKGCKSPTGSPRNASDAAHAAKVADSAKQALAFCKNRNPSVKCITTKGTILTSTAFTKEDDTLVDGNMTNDDRILATCMTLCKGNSEQIIGEPRKLHREVVLLTEDRNLRVKALARDVPVREVPSFIQWAGLG